MAAIGMAGEDQRSDSLNSQELRLALAMRGGVSLAVWIGGAVRELDELRRAPDHAVYGELLELAGYTRVVIDVLAGASAGGLNGALYAAALTYGIPFASMRDLWIGLADIERLSRSPFSSQDDHDAAATRWPELGLRPPSLLRGDGYFLAELSDRLRALAAAGDPPSKPPRLDVLLSATLWAPTPTETLADRFSRIEESRSDAYFHFRSRDDLLTHFPPDGPGRERALAELALAARATSSFPAAFEPAAIPFAPNGEAVSGGLDLSGKFTAPPPPGAASEVLVIDGGVLDNIPVSAAVRAIAAAPASEATDRWLLYLHPSPAVGDGAARRDPTTVGARPRAAAVVQRFLSARLGRETLLEDIDELAEINRELRAQQLRWSALVADLAATDRPAREAAAAAARRRDAHRDLRVATDVERVVELLTRPDERLATEPGVADRFGQPTAGWDLAAADLRAPVLSALRLRARREPEEPFRDARAVLLGADLVVRLVRWLERFAAPEALDTLGRAKRRAYRIRTMATVAAARADAAWPDAAARHPERFGSARDLFAWAITASEQSAAVSAAGVGSIATDLGFDLHADLGLRSGPAEGPDPRPGAGPGGRPEAGVASRPFAEVAWEVLGTAVAEVSAAVGGLAGVEDRMAGTDWSEGGAGADRVLERSGLAPAGPGGGGTAATDRGADPALVALVDLASPPTPDAAAEVLGSLVVLLTPLLASELPPGGEIRFLRVAGSNACAVADLLPALFGPGLPVLPQPLPTSADPGKKLCGDQLMNFAAFLSGTWRANDWMWGRLDAAKSIVDLLGNGRRLHTMAVRDGRHACDVAGRLRALASGAPGVGDELLARIDDEIRDLFATPDEPHPLEVTRWLLTRRLQWEVLVEEVPVVARTAHGHATVTPSPSPSPSPSTSAASGAAGVGGGADGASAVVTPAVLARYDVGVQTLRAAGQDRLARIAMRLALVGFRVVKPGPVPSDDPQGARRSLATRALLFTTLALCKPLYLVVAFTAAAPRRSRLLLAVFASGLVGLIWRRPERWTLLGGGAFLLSALLAVLVGAWAVSALARGRTSTMGTAMGTALGPPPATGTAGTGRGRALDVVALALVTAGLLLGALRWPAAGGSRAIVIGLLATLLVISGGFWMRPPARVALAVLAAGGYGVGALFARGDDGDWLGSGIDGLEQVRDLLRGGTVVAVAAVLAALAVGAVALRRATRPRPVLPPTIAPACGIAALWLAAWTTVARQPALGVSGWAAIALLAASYAQSIVITYWDVLPPRVPPADATTRAS